MPLQNDTFHTGYDMMYWSSNYRINFLVSILKRDGGGGRRKQKPAVQCLCWMGGIFCASRADVFGHQFSQSDCFIVTSCWGLRHLHSPFAPCGCSQSRLRIWFYKWFGKIITLASTCHSNSSPGNFARGVAGSGFGSLCRWWDEESLRLQLSCLPCYFNSQHLLWRPAAAETGCKAQMTPPWPACTKSIKRNYVWPVKPLVIKVKSCYLLCDSRTNQINESSVIEEYLQCVCVGPYPK